MRWFATIDLEDIGPVLFELSRRAKRLNITIRPFKGIRVAVPYGVPLDKAEKIVHSKITWIKKHLIRMKQTEQKRAVGENKPIIINRREAAVKIQGRLKILSEKHGFTYNNVSLRNQKSRWGSCSSRNNLSLNIKIAALPDELIDYVILHELVHTRIKNHSKTFWSELNRFVGDAKKLNSKLKSYQLQ